MSSMMPFLWTSPSVFKPVGRQIPFPWEWLEKRIANPKGGLAKESLPRIAFVEFRGGHRKLANIIRVHAVVLDIDDGAPLESLRRAFEGLYAIAYSTFSATEAAPRWRVIFPLDWPVETSEEHDRIWRWLAMKLEACGGSPDFGARDAAHCWAAPARPPSGHYVSEVLPGAFVNPKDAFAVIPAPIPPPPIERVRGDFPHERRYERARKYLERLPPAISGSGGHAATFMAAVKLVRGFGLDEADALSLLLEVHNPMCSPPWSLIELKHKVRQAFQRSKLPHGFLADRSRTL